MLLVLLFGRYIIISKDTYASFFSEWDSCFTLQLLEVNGFFFACLFVCFSWKVLCLLAILFFLASGFVFIISLSTRND